MLQRQAEWQRGRASASWPEKIRLVEQMRDSILLLRRSQEARKGQAPPKKAP
jgi:hypothetical protein